MRRSGLAVAVAIGLLVSVGTGSIAAPSPLPLKTCQGGWRMVRAPGASESTWLLGLAAVSKTDVWAVGDNFTAGKGLIEHWDGSAWTLVNDLNTGGLSGVAAASPTDVWAVGYGDFLNPLVLHWNGATWSEVPTPSPGPYGGVLDDVAMVTTDDVWAVGYAFGYYEGSSTVLIEHWDGAEWSIVPSPSPTGHDALLAVSADSASDIWAVGGQYPVQPLVEHWDGSAWTVAPQPASLVATTDAVAFGPNDVWTGGWAVGTAPGFAHWDGTKWTDVPSPPLSHYGQIFALSGPTTNKLFAVGGQGGGVLVERWDGATWQVVPAPTPGPSAELHDVSWTDGGPVWAVGTTEVNFGDPLVERTCRG